MPSGALAPGWAILGSKDKGVSPDSPDITPLNSQSSQVPWIWSSEVPSMLGLWISQPPFQDNQINMNGSTKFLSII